MRRLRESQPRLLSVQHQARVLGVGSLLFVFLWLVGAPTVKAHIETPDNITADVINHLEGDVGAGETFRDWSFLPPEQNPSNPACEKEVERFLLPDKDGKKRAVYKFKVVGNADGRAHAFEAGGFADSTLSSCRDLTGGAWLADGRVNLNAAIFRNPATSATIQRPINVKIGVTNDDEDDNGAVRYEFGEVGLFNGLDYDEKLAAGIKRTSDGGAFGAITNGAGYMVNDQTIWCAGLDGIANIQEYASWLNSRGYTINTRVQWSGLFSSNCYQNFLFRQGNNADAGIGNYDTRWGAFTSGAMGNQGAGWRNWFHDIGSDIPGLTRTGAAVNDFNLKAAGFINHDGAGTYNNNPLAGEECIPPGLNVDGCAIFVTPTPYRIPFVEAWFTMEWDPAGPGPEQPSLECTGVRLTPPVPEPNQEFSAVLNYIYSGPDVSVRYETNLVGIPGASVSRVVTLRDTGGETRSLPLGDYTGSAGIYRYTASITTLGGGAVISANCPGTVKIAAKPYFKIWSNDTQVGGNFAGANGQCSPAIVTGQEDATVIGYGGDGITDIFRGSSTEFGLSTLGEIRNFFSASQRSPRNNTGVNWPTPPHGLTFANAQIDAITGTDIRGDNNKVVNYGGFSGRASCATNWLGLVSDETPQTTNNAININAVSGTVRNTATGTVYISGGTVTEPTAIFLTEADNVIIEGNIGVDADSTLYIITNGNIKVQSDVGAIYAALITTKTLETCTQDNGAAWALPDLYTNCNWQLNIRGAVVANQIKLRRTFGSRWQSGENEPAIPNAAAEQIIFDTALYTIRPGFETPPSQKSEIDFMTSLPPIL